MQRPHTTVVLAMSADGKIADKARSRSNFSSPTDQKHLEKHCAIADAIIFGAGTLRAYGTTRSIQDPQLIHQRQQRQQPPQPVQIVVSPSGSIDPEIPFFRQPIPRWLITTPSGEELWRGQPDKFERILISTEDHLKLDWREIFSQLKQLGIHRLAVLGGGQLVASLVALNFIDELWLTICPLILGGSIAPTPVEGKGFLEKNASNLELLSVEKVAQEVFLHYRVLES